MRYLSSTLFYSGNGIVMVFYGYMTKFHGLKSNTAISCRLE